MLASLLLQIREATGASLALFGRDVPLVSGIADRIAALGAPGDVLATPEVITWYLGHRAADVAQVP